MRRRIPIIFAMVLFATCIFTQAGAGEFFTLIILGTRSASDIELIRKNIKALPYIKSFAPSQASQRHLEFTGTYDGPQEAFVADVESLSADRFEVNSKDEGKRGLVITLRKIQPAPVE